VSGSRYAGALGAPGQQGAAVLGLVAPGVHSQDATRLATRAPATLAGVPAFVYLLRCADGSLYCGWSTDPDRRLAQHEAGTASRYTRSRRPVELVWTEELASRSEAMRREAEIKRLPAAEKQALIPGRRPAQPGMRAPRR
jgi:putative endonuclease